MDIEHVSEFYREKFIPAYSDLVIFIGEKSEQIIVEIENILSHVFQYHNPEECISADQKKGIQGDLEYVGFNREKLDDTILKAIPYIPYIRDFYKRVLEFKGLLSL